MTRNALYYMVLPDTMTAPTDHLMQGYESEHDYQSALRRICAKYGNRTGERIAARHGFLLLRFTDTPDGYPDEEWLPQYLLRPVSPPVPDDASPDPIETELDEAFGFD